MMHKGDHARRPREAKLKPGRDIFGELSEGMAALPEHRLGKRTLRTHSVVLKDPPSLTPRDLVRIRANLRMSQAVFAGYLRTNRRTLENWEQGRAKPNAQAALLIHMVDRFPETIAHLAAV
jgi:putative transcriptional regulator